MNDWKVFPFIVIVTFILGFLSGLITDKDWLTAQEQAYIRKISAENELLAAEKKEWLAYIGEQLGDVEFLIPTNEEPFHHIAALLSQIGVEVKLLEENGVLQKEGILISVGNEENMMEGFKQLKIDSVPISARDIQQFYLSLLRMKEGE